MTSGKRPAADLTPWNPGSSGSGRRRPWG